MAWIRTQDKDFLLNVEGFQIKNMPNNLHELYAQPEPSDFFLGSFATQEAALAELDRIEKWISDGAQGVYQVSGE